MIESITRIFRLQVGRSSDKGPSVGFVEVRGPPGEQVRI